jgi:predicted ATP-grasp superfamily ATP-dependent carboligase
VKRVLVLDANQRSALAAIRSLGRRGIPVVAADEVGRTLGGASRYCRETGTYPSAYSDPDGFVDAVRTTVRARVIDIVLPMTEVTTELLLRHRGELGPVTVPFGSLEAFERLNDKRQLASLARLLDVPTPRTLVVESRDALAAVAEVVGFPVVLKPYRSRIPTASGWLPGEVRYARSARELEELVHGREPFRTHPFLVQEYVAGQGCGVFALYEHGRAFTFFAHRRLRERPPSGGVSVVSESVGVDAQLQQMVQRLLDHVGWHGVAMVEFKITPHGRACVLEVNPRFWGSLQLAIDAGVDFPWLLYRLADGPLPSPPDGYRVGVKTRWLLGDIDHLYLRLRDARDVRSRWRAVSAFLQPLGPGTRHEVDRWDDWGPFMTELWQYVAGPGR